MRFAGIALFCVTASCSLVVPLDDLGPGKADASNDASTPDADTDVDAASLPDVVTGDTGGDAPAADYGATILADGPLAYFRLDEQTGTTLADSSGNHHDAQLTGGVSLASAGAFAGSGTSVHFDGTGYLSINGSVSVSGTPFDFTGTNAFTLEAWIEIDSVPSAGYTFFSKEQYIGNSHYTGIDFFGQPKLLLQREDEPTDETEADAPAGLASTNVWYYVVGVFDGNTITIYVDNVTVAVFSGSQTQIPITTVPFLLGSEDTSFDSALVGKMDEVAIYAKALTTAQMTAHFHAAGH